MHILLTLGALQAIQAADYLKFGEGNMVDDIISFGALLGLNSCGQWSGDPSNQDPEYAYRNNVYSYLGQIEDDLKLMNEAIKGKPIEPTVSSDDPDFNAFLSDGPAGNQFFMEEKTVVDVLVES